MLTKAVYAFIVACVFIIAGPCYDDDAVPLDRLYIANHQTLVTTFDRQMTFTHEVTDILPSPAGGRIAFLTFHHGDEDSSVGLSTIAVGDTHTRQYYTHHWGPGENDEILGFQGGWSADTRFLSFTYSSMINGSFCTGIKIVDFSHGNTLTVVPCDPGENLHDVVWGPGDQLCMIVYGDSGASLLDYNALKKSTSIWPVSSKSLQSPAWHDSTHLVFFDSSAQEHHFVLNTVTGTVSPDTDKLYLAPIEPSSADVQQMVVPGTSLNITLEGNANSVATVAEDGSSHPPSLSFWVKVAGLPIIPNKRLGAGYLLLGSFLQSSKDAAYIQPKVLLPTTPSSTAVAFVRNGDLYVSSVEFAKATGAEMLQAGETLTCPEEEDLAMDMAKQIGLGILQYSQDYDETMPSAETFEDEVSPYLAGQNSKYSFISDKYKFQYELDSVGLASIESPATTEEGCFTLPCGKVVLWVDGHVQWQPIQEGAGDFPGWPTK
jgi:hypothetical protein